MKQAIIPLDLHNSMQNLTALNPLLFPVDEIPEPKLSNGRRSKIVDPFMSKPFKIMRNSMTTKGFLSGTPPRPAKFVYENGIPSFSSDAGLVVLNPFRKQSPPSTTRTRRSTKSPNKIPMKVSIGTLTEFNSLYPKIMSNELSNNEDYISNSTSSEFPTSRILFKKIEWKNRDNLLGNLNLSTKYREQNQNLKFDFATSKSFRNYLSNVIKDPFQPFRTPINIDKIVLKASQNESKLKFTSAEKLSDYQKPEEIFPEVIKHNPIHTINASKIEDFKTIKSVSVGRINFFKEMTPPTNGQKLLMEKQSILNMHRPSTSVLSRRHIERASIGPNFGIAVDDKIPFKNELIITKVIESKVSNTTKHYSTPKRKELSRQRSSCIDLS